LHFFIQGYKEHLGKLSVKSENCQIFADFIWNDSYDLIMPIYAYYYYYLLIDALVLPVYANSALIMPRAIPVT